MYRGVLNFMDRMPFLTPTSRNTLGFTFSASILNGKGRHSPLPRLFDASAPSGLLVEDEPNGLADNEQPYTEALNATRKGNQQERLE